MLKRLALAVLAVGLSPALTPALAQDSYGDPRAPVAGWVLGTTIRTQDAEELRYVILKRLTDRYATDKGIAVTQAEKDAYNKAVLDRIRQDRERQAARRDELQRKLAAQGLSDAERKSLAAELDTANQAVAALAEPAGKPDEIKAAREQIAGAFIRQWKINQALYRQYGGRVIFQQGGPEPLDAYRRFLQERQARGDFAIQERTLVAAFWRYYYADSIHSFYPPGSKEEVQAFGTPPWLSK
jgi:hypothetical protein